MKRTAVYTVLFARYQLLRGTICAHSSAKKLRFAPGAIWAAIIAASIGKVPLPQKGSTKILSFCQGVIRRTFSGNAKHCVGDLYTKRREILDCEGGQH